VIDLQTKLVGIVPEVIEITTLEMTQPVIEGSKLMEKTFLNHMNELGFKYELIEEVDIQTVANDSCKEER